MSGRPFCAEASRENGEALAATASRVDRWILVEYSGLWGRDAVAASNLSVDIKEHLRERMLALAPAKVLFVRRRERRSRPDCVFWGSAAGMQHAELDSYDDLLELDFATPGERVEHPLLLVCTHGKHDRCCARHGQPLFEALRELADPDWVWQASHLGGDRFAGNLVCLPEGLYFGRVGPGEAAIVLEDYLAGRIHLPCYRGRAAYSMPVQAAERAVREHTGSTGLDALELVSEDPIRFRAGGRVFEVEVERVEGELSYVTCDATRLSRPRRYVAGTPRESGA